MGFRKVKPWMKGLFVKKGKIVGLAEPGWHFIGPGKKLIKVDIRPHVIELVSQRLHASDGKDVDFRYTVRYRIRDPDGVALPMVGLPIEMDEYIHEDPFKNVRQVATVIGYASHYVLREAVAGLTLAGCRRREEMSGILKEGLRKAFSKQGIVVEKVDVTDAYPTNKGVDEGVAAITYMLVNEDGTTKILQIAEVDVHPAGLKK